MSDEQLWFELPGFLDGGNEVVRWRPWHSYPAPVISVSIRLIMGRDYSIFWVATKPSKRVSTKRQITTIYSDKYNVGTRRKL